MSEMCRCGHTKDRHLPFVQEMQDACAGGTPGFCGCSGYTPAAPDRTCPCGTTPDPGVCPNEAGCPWPDHGSHCLCAHAVPPRPSAPDATAGGELREAAVEAIRDLHAQSVSFSEPSWAEMTDAVLALPALRDVLAAAARDAEAVARVRKLIAFYDRHEYATLNVDDLRRALDVP